MEESMKANLAPDYLMEINIPPAQDAPKHILNVLNDDCIQAILSKLTKTEDYLNAAKTCRQFQMNAIQGYPSQFKSFGVNICSETLSLEHELSFINMFGNKIEELVLSIECLEKYEKWNDIFNVIANCCGKTLSKLDIIFDDLCITFNTLSQFKALVHLCICHASVKNVGKHANLKELFFWRVKCRKNFKWVQKEFPKLEKATFSEVDIKDDAFIKFQTLNPQLQYLKVEDCNGLTSSVIYDISNRLTNIVTLELSIKSKNIQEYNDTVVNLGKLQNLKCLKFRSYEFPKESLIHSLSENVTTLEELSIYGNDKEFVGIETDLFKFKKLKKFAANMSAKNSAKVLIKMAKELTALKIIYAHSYSSDISVDEIIKVLGYGKKLTRFAIWMKNFNINLNDYESILALVKGRIELDLFIDNGNIDVDEKILKENEKWFCIHR